MKKLTLLLILGGSIHFSFGQKLGFPSKTHQKAFIGLDYLSVKMPLDSIGIPEDNMGFTGIHYNLWLNKSIYAGAGFYGSVNGIRGGLFTLGFNAGIKKEFSKHWFVDAGIHFGGGGGASAPDGGGAFLLPHLNLGYALNNFSVTAGYSAINFFDKGNISSQQLNFGVQIPVSFDYSLFKEREQSYTVTDLVKSAWNQPSKRISLLLHLNNLSPYGDSKLTDGSLLKGKTIQLAGFEINSYFNDQWFAFFKADGAYHGIQGGYMDLFLGGGYHFSMNKDRTNILAKFGLGAGGGGGVDSGGGFFIYPELSIEQRLFDEVYLAINKGYLMSLNNHFASTTLGFGLKYYVHQQGLSSSDGSQLEDVKIKGVQFILGQEMYLNADRMLEPTEHLHQFALQVNIFMNKHLYLAGHTSFADFGNAGAYAEGLVGAGYRSKKLGKTNVSLFGQVLLGAAGGGDIGTGQGLIVKPSAGLDYQLNNQLSLRTAFGYVKARGGLLSSPSISLGLNYSLGILTAK